MPQSLSMNIVHLIYSTKNRHPWLTPEIRPALFAYQAGVFKKLDSQSIVIGGVHDHLHALFVLSKNRALCDIIEGVKRSSSKWIKTQGAQFRDFHWQGGYGAFSVSQSQVPKVRQYIEQQEEHHKVLSFQDEFRAFLKRNRVDYDEKYVWD